LFAINKRLNRKPEAFTLVFTNGGPDHNILFINVQLSWLAYFILVGADSLVDGRTTPTQSWTNPVERVMSVLNLALANCALARKIMGDEFEINMKKGNNMGSARKMAEQLDSGALAIVVDDSGVGANNDVAVDEVTIPPMEVEIIVNTCDIGEIAPEFDLSQELREHMNLCLCHQPMEFDYYQAKVVAAWFHANLCAYCAGSSGTEGFVDERLTQD
jgi:hypothetical protein